MNNFRLPAGMLLSVIAGLLLAFTQYWFLIFIPLFFIGIFLAEKFREALLLGIFAGLGMLLQIFIYNGAYRISEATLISNVAGLPGGAIIFMAFAFLIEMFLGFFGAQAGYSLAPLLGNGGKVKEPGEEKDVKKNSK